MIHPSLGSPGAELRRLIQKGIVILPGAYDAITAKLAEQAGAKAIYLSGAGVTNSMTAMPDIGLITLGEMARQAAYVCEAVKLPVVADADTGYGETMNVIRCVKRFEKAGLAGLHIEDQVSPKRCGHLGGKKLIEPEAMVEKIHAAVHARNDDSFFIIARTDASGVTGLEDAIKRGARYASAGADCVFPEGLETKGEFEAFRKGVQGHLLANMTEFGKTPLIPAAEFEELGYNLVIFPMTAFRVMMKGVSEAYKRILNEGTQMGILDCMRTRQELYDLIEYPAYEELDRRIASEAEPDKE